MISAWYQSNAIGWKPPEKDNTSSPTTAYQRRDFTSGTTEEGHVSWHYEERTMSHDEFLREVEIPELASQLADMAEYAAELEYNAALQELGMEE